MSEFDLAIIGSGPGGYRAAVLASLHGLSVAIIEKAQWGGCCLNRGCVPKKDWHHSAKLLAASRKFSKRGIRGSLTPDFAAAWAHQREVVETVRDSYVDYMKRLGIQALTGTARFVDSHTLAIGQTQVKARHIIIATGSAPYIPDGYSLSQRVFSSDELFDRPPPTALHIGIVGRGVIATEFAFILTELGHRVEWYAGGSPLRRSQFSQPALKLLDEALKAAGVSARTERPRAARATNKDVEVELETGNEHVDWLLLATGRKPHTADLALDAVGIETDGQEFIATNRWLETSLPHVYAIGDVANPAMTANHALAEASLAVANVVKPRSAERDPRRVPEAVYSALELARVGRNEDQAEDEGLEPAVGFAAFETNPCALGQDAREGFVRLIADLDEAVLLGGEIVGDESAELIHLVAERIDDPHGLHGLAHAFYNHPARNEELLNATETLAAKWGLKTLFDRL